MRHVTLSLGACLALLAAAGTARPQDETDRIVRGKKASEWMQILRTHKDPRTRRIALIALDQAGPQTRKIFDTIGAALRDDKEIAVRQGAALTLGRLGAKALDERTFINIPIVAGVEALAFAIKHDKSPVIREAAAAALARIASSVKDAPAEVRATVPTLAAALKDESPDVRVAAADGLGAIGSDADKAVTALIQAVRDNKGKEGIRVRTYLVSALGRIGKPSSSAVDILVDQAFEAEPAGVPPQVHGELRRAAVTALGLIGNPEALPPLAKLLEDAMTVREVKVKDDRGERVLRQVKDLQMTRIAMTALNHYGFERKSVLPTLLKATAIEQDQYVRCQALHAIGQLGKELGADLGGQRKAVLTAFRNGMADKINDVALASILSLGELGRGIIGADYEVVRDDLKRATRAPQRAISDAATSVLKQLADQQEK
ncbi:MAG: HEAT repeat domain-containing protein [Planctomycetes bacterium]|nr:HEAT repeat domain-containing protein [Planctomycetota bacterium]